MNIFLTGATGFIGSHLARRLVGEGHTVHALVRPGSDLWRIRDILPALRLVQGDLLAPEGVTEQLAAVQPELCLHLAWYAVPGRYLTALENLAMLSASLRLAGDLAQVGCRRLVVTGTCFEYNTDVGRLAEDSATRPRHLYSACKLALLHVLQQLSLDTGLEVAWPRVFYLYGPGEDERRLVPSVVLSLLRGQPARLTSGEQVRDFLHVADVAAAIWAVAQSGLRGPVNIGSGHPVAVRALAETIGALLQRPDLLNFGALPQAEADPPVVYADNRRLVEGADWAPRFDLEEGLRDTIHWWQERVLVAAPSAER